jgi:Pyruvate/2-oxoacid:ferredoxin oxidoreductase delta subunit
MKRQIIQIDEEKCNGCGLCVPNCHEGALQIIDGKARLISDLFCDGLGACIGHCPEGAIEIVEREAEPYDEKKVMELIVPKGRNTILAHLEHLRDHNEQHFLAEAIAYIKENNIDMSTDKNEQSGSGNDGITAFPAKNVEPHGIPHGCPGAAAMDFRIDEKQVEDSARTGTDEATDAPSELRQWPVQLHLLNPQASYFRNADVVLAADCVAFSMGNFHSRFLKGKSIAIACPKLDSNKESYIQKLTSMIADAKINSLTVAIMEVPCCGGLLQMAKTAKENAGRNIPIKLAVVSVTGEVIDEDWV